MTPATKVIPIRQAHVIRNRKKRATGRPSRAAGLFARASRWLMSETTKGTVLLGALVAGLAFGAVVGTVILLANNPSALMVGAQM